MHYGRGSPYIRNGRVMENNCVSSSANPSHNSMVNNVLANLQQIIQKAPPVIEEEEEEEEQTRREHFHHKAEAHENVPHHQEYLEPHKKALRYHLAEFGVSYMERAPLSPGYRPGDEMAYPGVHNMLSVCQSAIMSPYRSCFKQAVIAKYVPDEQLAAIASRSSAMRNGNARSSSGRRSNPSNRFGVPESEHPADKELSVATKDFLRRYNLMDDD